MWRKHVKEHVKETFLNVTKERRRRDPNPLLPRPLPVDVTVTRCSDSDTTCYKLHQLWSCDVGHVTSVMWRLSCDGHVTSLSCDVGHVTVMCRLSCAGHVTSLSCDVGHVTSVFPHQKLSCSRGPEHRPRPLWGWTYLLPQRLVFTLEMFWLFDFWWASAFNSDSDSSGTPRPPDLQTSRAETLKGLWEPDPQDHPPSNCSLHVGLFPPPRPSPSATAAGGLVLPWDPAVESYCLAQEHLCSIWWELGEPLFFLWSLLPFLNL